LNKLIAERVVRIWGWMLTSRQQWNWRSARSVDRRSRP